MTPTRAMQRPSARPRHTRTANAVLALLDAAWQQRKAGRRAIMRRLAHDVIALAKQFNEGTPRQLQLGL